MRQQRTASGPLPARHLRVPHDAAGRRARRRAVELLARDRDGVVSRRQLKQADVSRWQIRAELQARRWRAHGRQVIAVHTGELAGTAPYWAAVFEAGPRAVIDGASALRLAGLTGWREDAIRVSVPRGARIPRRPGLDVRQTRRLRPDDVEASGVPRVLRPVAAVRAALWARSDRAAATLLAMAVQQRLVAAEQVGVALLDVHRDKRRRLLETVVLDLIAGAHSLGELDVARDCRRRGLPEPSRQVVRTGRRGSLYLDVRWDAYGVVLEIDGIQHAWVQSVVPDALRHNWIALDGDTVLRMPLLGLRVAPDEFFEQVESALRASGWRRHAA